MFRAGAANILLEHWLGLLTGTTATSIITEHNQRHHGHNNTSDDFVRASLVNFRSQWLNVLCFFPRVWFELIFRKPSDFRVWWNANRRLFWRAAAEQMTLWGTWVLLVVDWRATLLYVACPGCTGSGGSLHLTCCTSGVAPDDPWQNSRNLIGRATNFFFFNVGYHTAHHLRPTLHWSELPRFHEEQVAPKIDPRLVSSSLWGFYRDWFSRRSLPALRLARERRPRRSIRCRAVDRSRRFLPRTHLAARPHRCYARISPPVRLRYNQLFASSYHEHFIFLERTLAAHVLPALVARFRKTPWRSDSDVFAMKKNRTPVGFIVCIGRASRRCIRKTITTLSGCLGRPAAIRHARATACDFSISDLARDDHRGADARGGP